MIQKMTVNDEEKDSEFPDDTNPTDIEESLSDRNDYNNKNNDE